MFAHKTVSRSFLTALMFALSAGFAASSAGAADLSQYPLNLLTSADPNILFNLSIETPMGGAAYNDGDGPGGSCSTHGRMAYDIGNCYIPTNTYVGYFDSDKCYDYQNNRFEPASATADAAKHTCSNKFSGNFMNWATMTAMDAFIYTMTGGNRVVDTDSLTVVERAKASLNSSWFPYKYFTTTDGVTPSNVINGSGGASGIYLTRGEWTVDIGTTKGGNSLADDYNVKIKVCDSTAGVEDNCTEYENDAGTTYYKPEGLIQNNAEHKRFAVTSYLQANANKDGGVLRANMKYVGPNMPQLSGFGAMTTNANREWGDNGDANAGIYIDDPDGQVGAGGVVYSGVINYINRFSRQHGYKSSDPASELFYESLRYFRGQTVTPHGPTTSFAASSDTERGGFPAYTTWEDPIQYKCQKNFIVGINDANPWLDKKLPGTYFTSSTMYGHTLANGDYGNPSNPDNWFDVTRYTNQVGNLQGINGTSRCIGCVSGECNSGALSATVKNLDQLGQVFGTCYWAPKENSYYIAGLAYQANTQDMRDDFDGEQTVSTFLIDTQEYASTQLTGEMNMLWLAGKYGGFVDENDNDQPDLQSEWDANNDNEPDNYVLATDPSKMVAALNKTFEDIDNLDSSSSAVVANSVRLTTGTQIYQAMFNSGDWSGDLLALPVAMDGSIGAAVWSTRTQVEAQNWSTGRNIFTYNPASGSGEVFTWSGIASAQQDALNINPDSGSDDSMGQDRLEYIRGNGSEEESEGGSFRDRDYKLGDLINSSPIYVGAPAFGYSDAVASDSYNTFVSSNSSRTPVIYVGGNDGMLHGINANTGSEVMAYVPGFILPELNELTSMDYNHRYYVDGNATYGDAFFDSAGGSDDEWHSVLAGSARAGGQGYFLLDITDPSAFSQSLTNAGKLALWEFTDADDADLGYSFSQAAIVKMHNGEWAVVFGNGYHSTEADGHVGTGHAVLYILFIEKGVDGEWATAGDFVKIDTGVGSVGDPNGLSTPAPVDVDGDSMIDYIYAGDLHGNMWKFDVTHASNTAQWKVEGNKRLFTAASASGDRQPITVKPDVRLHPLGGYMVYFGTGKFFDEGDGNPNTYGDQSFYGVRDNGSKELTRGTLQAQTVVTTQTAAGGEYRITSNNTIDWNTQDGWYMDLPENGELVVANPQLNHDNIVFVTQTPSSDPCECGGSSWLMELDAITGGWPVGNIFDTNNDSVIDESDYLTYLAADNIATGTRQPDDGIYTSPTILPAGTKEYKFMSKSTSGVAKVLEAGGIESGRQSWEQIR